LQRAQALHRRLTFFQNLKLSRLICWATPQQNFKSMPIRGRVQTTNAHRVSTIPLSTHQESSSYHDGLGRCERRAASLSRPNSDVFMYRDRAQRLSKDEKQVCATSTPLGPPLRGTNVFVLSTGNLRVSKKSNRHLPLGLCPSFGQRKPAVYPRRARLAWSVARQLECVVKHLRALSVDRLMVLAGSFCRDPFNDSVHINQVNDRSVAILFACSQPIEAWSVLQRELQRA
jgi:hypothetical protein